MNKPKTNWEDIEIEIKRRISRIGGILNGSAVGDTGQAVVAEQQLGEILELLSQLIKTQVDYIESCKKPSTIHTKIHKNHQDLYDSAFIEGWNFALDKVIKHLLKI